MTNARIVFSVLFCLGAASPASAAHWPVFRADAQNTGRSAVAVRETPVRAAAEGPRAPWSIATRGLIWATPVSDLTGNVYVGSADKSFHKIDPAGRVLWSHRIFDRADSLIDSAAAIHEGAGLVIVPGGDGYLHALDLATGAPAWTFKAHHSGDDDHSSGVVVNSFEGNVTVGPNGLAYAGSDNGYLYAVDRAGREAWSFRTGMMVWSSPAFDPAGRWLAFGSLDGNLYLLDASTGALLDRARIGADVKASPAFDAASSRLYFGSSDGKFHSYAVRARRGGFRLRREWSFRTGDEVYSSAALRADGSRVFFGSLDGRLYCLDREGKEVWRYDARSRIAGSPALSADGVVFFGARNGKLYALDSATGRRIWSYRTTASQVKSNLDSSASVTSDARIAIGSYGGRVYSIPFEHCLSQADPACERGGSSDSPGFGGGVPADGVVLRFEDREGNWHSRPAQPVAGVTPLRLRLLAFERGAWIDNAAIDPSSLRVEAVQGGARFLTRVSGDGHTLNLVPLSPLQPGARHVLRISGRTFHREHWLGDRFKWIALPRFEVQVEFESAATGESDLGATLERMGARASLELGSMFLFQPQSLETYTPAALDGQAFVGRAVALDRVNGRFLLLALPAQVGADGSFAVLPEPARAVALEGTYRGGEFRVSGGFNMSAMGGQARFRSAVFSGVAGGDGTVREGEFFIEASCLSLRGNGSSGYRFPMQLIDRTCDHRLRLIGMGRHEGRWTERDADSGLPRASFTAAPGRRGRVEVSVRIETPAVCPAARRLLSVVTYDRDAGRILGREFRSVDACGAGSLEERVVLDGAGDRTGIAVFLDDGQVPAR